MKMNYWKPFNKDINSKKGYLYTNWFKSLEIKGKLKTSDDGEPSGTAGNPIQEAIIQNQLDNICIVVIRYFGGIKLGAGGLTRAYINTAVRTIATAKISTVTSTTVYNLIYEYNLNNIIQKYLNDKHIYIVTTEYEIKIKTTIATNENIDDLLDLTNGKILIEKKEPIILIK